MKKTRIAPILYMLIILIAGFANAAAKLITKEYNAGAEWHMIAPAFSTLLFCVNLLLYLFLIVFWMQSVRLRLLPSRARSYLIAASWCAVAMLVLTDKTLNWLRLPSMFTAPEIVSFGMIGIFESCVRNRLILYNENYSGFFAQMRFPAIITHADYTVAYRSAKALDASTDQLRKALNAPLYLDENTKLTGKPITAGYAFYTDDESELHHMNDRLTEANGLIASENDLIQAENELKARQAAVDARSLVYSQIDDRMLPYHRAALRLLDEMRPGTPEFQRQAARLNFLNAYIKRGTNLLLTNEGEESIPMKELGMAFDEASVYLQYCGVKAVVSVNDEGSISRDGALMLFTAFYEIAQRLLDSADIIQASVKDRRLRMIADCPEPPAMPEHVRMEQGDGLWYFSVTVGEGGAA